MSSPEIYEKTEQLTATIAVAEAPILGQLTTGETTKKLKLKFTPFRLAIYAIILVVVAIYLFPLLYMLDISGKTDMDFMNDPTSITTNFQFSNFVDAWVQGNFTTYLINTVLYTGCSTLLQVVFALMAAYPIARGYVKWGGFWLTFFIASLFLPNALIPQFQLMLALHLYNTQIGYILLSSAVGIGPFLIFGYLKTVPKELDEAAAIDGCGYFRCLFTIIAPLAKPVLVTVAILHAIGVWNDIIGPTIYLTDQQYYPIALGLHAFQGQFSMNYPLLAAGTVIAAVPLLIMYLFFQRYFIEGAVSGAVKA